MLLDMAEEHLLVVDLVPLLLGRWMENLVMVEGDPLSPNPATRWDLDQEDLQLHLHQWTTGQDNQVVSLQIMLVLPNLGKLVLDLVTVSDLSKVQERVHHQEWCRWGPGLVLRDSHDMACQWASKEASTSIQASWAHQGKTKLQISYMDS